MKHTPLVIIGSGPAGYTAGVYAGRAQLEPVLFAGYEMGGQLMWTTEVENFPGFPEGIRGPQLMAGMQKQATRFGTTVRAEFVTAVDFSARPFRLWSKFPDGVSFEAFKDAQPEQLAEYQAQVMSGEPAITTDAVIIATGASSIMVGAQGESEFLGKGVSTCAVCDAAFFKDKTTFVIGGGDSAMEDALALSKFAKSVTIVHRRDQFRASKIMSERVLNHEKIRVLWNASLQSVHGTTAVERIMIKTEDGLVEHEADGVFVAIGHRPMNRIFTGQIELDSHGYAVTRQSATRLGVAAASSALSAADLVQYPTMTSVPGVFAAGDGVDVRYKQAITAAGQGAAAALDAERWLEAQENL